MLREAIIDAFDKLASEGLVDQLIEEQLERRQRISAEWLLAQGFQCSRYDIYWIDIARDATTETQLRLQVVFHSANEQGLEIWNIDDEGRVGVGITMCRRGQTKGDIWRVIELLKSQSS